MSVNASGSQNKVKGQLSAKYLRIPYKYLNKFIPSNIHGLTLGKPAKHTCCEFLMRARVNKNVMHDSF